MWIPDTPKEGVDNEEEEMPREEETHSLPEARPLLPNIVSYISIPEYLFNEMSREEEEEEDETMSPRYSPYSPSEKKELAPKEEDITDDGRDIYPF